MATIDMKRLRVTAGIGQRELARRMEVTARVALKWDKGAQPKAERLPRLVEVFGLDSIEDLFDGVE